MADLLEKVEGVSAKERSQEKKKNKSRERNESRKRDKSTETERSREKQSINSPGTNDKAYKLYHGENKHNCFVIVSFDSMCRLLLL